MQFHESCGRIKAKAGNVKEAIMHYETLLKENPVNYDTY